MLNNAIQYWIYFSLFQKSERKKNYIYYILQNICICIQLYIDTVTFHQFRTHCRKILFDFLFTSTYFVLFSEGILVFHFSKTFKNTYENITLTIYFHHRIKWRTNVCANFSASSFSFAAAAAVAISIFLLYFS